MKPHEMHREHAKHVLAFHLITVSSSRFKLKDQGTEYDDASGDLAFRMIQDAGHKVDLRRLIPDSKAMIQETIEDFLDSGAHTLLVIGGTGVSPDDITVETVTPFLEKELPGFGELLRSLSYRTIGGAALLTRATAGTVRGKLIVCIPGSPNAVEVALGSFMSEFPHIVSIAGGLDDHGNRGRAETLEQVNH